MMDVGPHGINRSLRRHNQTDLSNSLSWKRPRRERWRIREFRTLLKPRSKLIARITALAAQHDVYLAEQILSFGNQNDCPSARFERRARASLICSRTFRQITEAMEFEPS